MAQKIVIYHDEGAKDFCVRCLLKFFSKDDIALCDAASVVDGSAFQDCDIFVMPGGADLPYAKKLDGAGNRNIRIFVENGGTYLGICAGAYYACKAIEYHKGRGDEICQPRELALVPATAVGSLPELAPHYDGTLHSAAITDITLSTGEKTKAFYQGGCRFDIKNHDDLEILATYNLPGNPPAIVRKKLGQGTVVLSGIHFEIGRDELPFHPDEITKALKLAKLFDEQNITNWKSLIFKN